MKSVLSVWTIWKAIWISLRRDILTPISTLCSQIDTVFTPVESIDPNPFSNRLKIEIGKNNIFCINFKIAPGGAVMVSSPIFYVSRFPSLLLSKYFLSLCATKEEKLSVWADSTKQQTSNQKQKPLIFVRKVILENQQNSKKKTLKFSKNSSPSKKFENIFSQKLKKRTSQRN